MDLLKEEKAWEGCLTSGYGPLLTGGMERDLVVALLLDSSALSSLSVVHTTTSEGLYRDPMTSI